MQSGKRQKLKANGIKYLKVQREMLEIELNEFISLVLLVIKLCLVRH